MFLVLFVMLSVLRVKDNFVIELVEGEKNFSLLQSNLDYLDSLGPAEIVRIIDSPDNRKYEY